MHNFFRNDKGELVVFQPPNIPVIAATLLWVCSFLPGVLGDICRVAAFGIGFAWAWLEATSGESHFRRLLGFVVAVVLLFIGVQHQ